MSKSNHQSTGLILNAISNEKQKSSEQLNMVQKTQPSMEQMLELPEQVANTCKINKRNPSFKSAKAFLLSRNVLWYWLALILGIFAVVSVFIPLNIYSIAFVKSIFGFVLFILPGFTLIRVMYPYRRGDSESLYIFVRILLSVITSAAIVSLTSFALNYTQSGVTSISLSVTLLILISFLATIGIVREWKMRSTDEVLSN